MFYATYKGIGKSDIAEFQTEKERDDWVNFNDELSKVCKVTKKNCFFERTKLTDENIIKKIVNNNLIQEYDTYNPNQKWYLLSIK